MKQFCNTSILETKELYCYYYYTTYVETFVPANFKHVSQYYDEIQF